MRALTVFAMILALSGPGLASTLTGSTGNLDLTLAGQIVHFAPAGANNLSLSGDFAGAAPGSPISAEVTALDFGSIPPPVVFQQGAYNLALQLEPLTHSTGHVTTTAGGTFAGVFHTFFAVSFSFTGPGSGGGSGDVLGEFGGLPGISNCVNAAVSTCELQIPVALSGSFDIASGALTGVSAAPSAVPEPATLLLGGAALLLIGLLRRR
jgi:hypothetical protein